MSSRAALQVQYDACKTLRRAAVSAVLDCVTWLERASASEAAATSYFVSRLVAHGAADYWYPAGENSGADDQNGTIVLFDTRAEPRRTLFDNGRFARPRKDVCWEGLGYFYASPFDMVQWADGSWCTVFGDFAVSVYTGRDVHTRAVFARRWQLHVSLGERLQSGDILTTLDLFQQYESLASRYGLENTARSVTGRESTNIGHSIPLIVTPHSSARASAKERARTGRLFIDGGAASNLSGHLWTLESRDRTSDYQHGAVSFHDIVALGDDVELVAPGFGKFFEEVGMHWLGAAGTQGT